MIRSLIEEALWYNSFSIDESDILEVLNLSKNYLDRPIANNNLFHLRDFQWLDLAYNWLDDSSFENSNDIDLSTTMTQSFKKNQFRWLYLIKFI